MVISGSGGRSGLMIGEMEMGASLTRKLSCSQLDGRSVVVAVVAGCMK